ncbi:unnamed protein product, partial [Nesidiocoris tenuis]
MTSFPWSNARIHALPIRAHQVGRHLPRKFPHCSPDFPLYPSMDLSFLIYTYDS